MARRMLGLFGGLVVLLPLLSCLDLKQKARTGSPDEATATGSRTETTAQPPPVNKVASSKSTNPGTISTRPVPTKPKPTPFGEPLEIDSIVVMACRAELGKTLIHDPKRDSSKTSEDRFLTILLAIGNWSETKKMSYETWDPHPFRGNEAAMRVHDEFGNEYNRVAFGEGLVPSGRTRSAPLYPGDAILDAIVFELPIERATELVLELPGKNVGVDGTFRFRLDVKKLRAGEYDIQLGDYTGGVVGRLKKGRPDSKSPK